MRLLSIFLLFFCLVSCNKSAQSPSLSPEVVATSFILEVFAKHDTIKAAEFATGEFKDKIANSNEEEIKQLNQISNFTYSNVVTETKQSTGLSVVTMDTIMNIQDQQFKGKKTVVLKLVDNQWLVYSL
ncbi:hypothetical protein [Marinicellulosiphila megalodicopiae]|uniref:hypothetical protein n=1 Tax=Marinicellulosiphila megalodicopiae TaxID=2724896 RepID=UPI003BAF33FC